MKFVEDTEQHSQDKERRQQAEWEALSGGRPPSRTGGGGAGGAAHSTKGRPSTAMAASGGSTPMTGTRRPGSARQSDSRDEFFQRLRDDLDRRTRCGRGPGGEGLRSAGRRRTRAWEVQEGGRAYFEGRSQGTVRDALARD